MPLVTLGLNHTTAPVAIRERLTFGPDIIVAALVNLTALDDISEAIILSTCNRTELYCNSSASDNSPLVQWLCDFHGLQIEDVNPYVYLHENNSAIDHLLKVASGLDSLVLGEPQILGQVKTAWQTASDAGTVGKILGRLFQHSFNTAKQVRTDTAIGDSPVSVAFAAVTLSRQIFSDLSNQTALLIGAGETIELAARHLKQQGVPRIVVANRTLAKAHTLADQFDGYAISLSDIPKHIAEADIVISSTASPIPIVGKGTVETALKQRKHRPMFIVDIAVPRDIEAEVADLDDVYLYTVDDLDAVIQENLQSRQEAAEQAKEIIALQIEEFNIWLRSLDAINLIQDFRERGEQHRDVCLAKAKQQLKQGKSAEEVIEFLACTLTNKLLHTPSTQMRQASSAGQKDLLQAANTLFQLNAKDQKK